MSNAARRDAAPGQAVLTQRGQATSTTLSGSHFDVFELQHPLEIVRLSHEEMGGQDFLDDGAHTRQRQMRLTPSTAFALEKAVGESRQDHMALPAGQAAPFEVIEPDLVFEFL